MSWFSRSSELKSDSPQQLDSYQAWPPTFQTFEEYKNELETAINEHPPFGEWVKKYRNKEHVLNCNDNQSMWAFSIDQLKEQYVKCTRLRTTTMSAKRMFAELHLLNESERYIEAETKFEEATKIYNSAVEEYDVKAKHGYASGRRPQPPQKDPILHTKKRLHDIIDQCSDPVSVE
jgi:ATP-dependent Zn protease